LARGLLSFDLDIREEIRRLKSELKQLYDEPQLKQVKTNEITIIIIDSIDFILDALHITFSLCT
jgi:hypothetical protein